MSKYLFLLITFLLFFGILAPIIHAQNITSNSFCTDVGGADPKQNPCAQALGNLTFYCQHDERWRRDPYACQNITKAGCGPTTMAMVLSAYGSQLTPADLARMYTGRYDTCGRGTAMPASLQDPSFKNLLGIEVASGQLVSGSRLNMKLAEEYLDPTNGYLIIGSSENFPSCDCGHIFVVQAASESTGMVKIRDPNNCSSDGLERPGGIDYRMDRISWFYAFAVRKAR